MCLMCTESLFVFVHTYSRIPVILPKFPTLSRSQGVAVAKEPASLVTAQTDWVLAH